ncbi:uracil-DNA glycosylase-like [Ruditapes philippinarum]|uniref:uracil-DNA glycosylase-like n=1 Tax=Ruditapes philippinarum TaxID=129788 RepID=UPI00295BD07B|nr:uracil-DNA glycosylase-like [Ruditapes philippinarum]XP_060599947.1 uracil-DNA glycosylase-like [Ruditapes philippinarum]
MEWNLPPTGELHLMGFLNDDLWRKELAPQFEQPYFRSLEERLQKNNGQIKKIFPPPELVFNALNLTPLKKVKVVILGLDPYHGYGQAMGLAFSVPIGIPVPCSLQNIYKMLYNDPDIPEFVISDGNLVNLADKGVWIPNHGCLVSWAQQGVLLLNSSLTVEAGDPESHAKIGWQHFTDEIIRKVSEYHKHVVFILMGDFAKKKKKCIKPLEQHKIIETTHPASRGQHQDMFQDSYCFSVCNNWLKTQGLTPVQWNRL